MSEYNSFEELWAAKHKAQDPTKCPILDFVCIKCSEPAEPNESLCFDHIQLEDKYISSVLGTDVTQFR